MRSWRLSISFRLESTSMMLNFEGYDSHFFQQSSTFSEWSTSTIVKVSRIRMSQRLWLENMHSVTTSYPALLNCVNNFHLAFSCCIELWLLYLQVLIPMFFILSSSFKASLRLINKSFWFICISHHTSSQGKSNIVQSELPVYLSSCIPCKFQSCKTIRSSFFLSV